MNIEAVRSRLIGYIVPNGGDVDTKWQEKAVKSLVKKVTKSNQLNILEKAISERDSTTPCITINRSQDGRLQIGTKKGWPHVFYCQLWRWPDLHTQHELKPISSCLHAFHRKVPEVCVNPYHYVRIQNPPIMVPNYVGSGRTESNGNAETADDYDISVGSGRLYPEGEENGPEYARLGNYTSTPGGGGGGGVGSDSRVFVKSCSSTSSWSPLTNDIVGLSPASVSTLVSNMSPMDNTNNLHQQLSRAALKDDLSVVGTNGGGSGTSSVGGATGGGGGDSWTDPFIDDNKDNIFTTTSPEDDLMDIQFGPDAAVLTNENFDSQSPSSTLAVPAWMSPSPLHTYTPVEYCPMDEWCRVYYFEFNQRVGDTFHCSNPHLTVDGFTDPNQSDRFCLGALTNVKREREADLARRFIGHGLTLFYLGGEVIVECNGNGENSIFVQSPNCNYMYQWHLATVVKVPSGCNLTIFNNEIFASLLNRYVNENYESVYELGKMCVLRISFVKGWGASYKRPDITSTPCWIEVHLNGPLQWLDRVLQQMGSSSKKCSSKS